MTVLHKIRESKLPFPFYLYRVAISHQHQKDALMQKTDQLQMGKLPIAANLALSPLVLLR